MVSGAIMPNNMKHMAYKALAITIAAASLIAGTLTIAHAQDFSRSYRYGGGVNIPGAGDGDSGGGSSDIVDINVGIDAGGVLGCSGLDLKGMIQSTLNVGDIAGEFQTYLQNKVATEALTLIYSQPGVSQVLDGLKAVGHARASIMQEKCNANAIMADVTNKRLQGEAQDLCLKDKGNMVECEGASNLGKYIDKLANTLRWKGTLHDHICKDDSAVCKFLPNFAFNANTKEGKEASAEFDDNAVRTKARSSAFECMEARGQQAATLLDEVGYACAQKLIGTGEVKISCSGDGGGNSGGASCEEGGSDGDQSAVNPDAAEEAASGLTTAEACVMEGSGEDGPSQIDVSDLGTALDGAAGTDLMALIDAHIDCIIDKEIHGHVDLNIVTAPAVDAMAAWNGLSQVFATKAFLELNAVRIRKVSQAIVNSGGRDNANSCEVDSDGNKKNANCQDTPPPPLLDTAAALLEQFRYDQKAALAELEMAERVAERINRMNQDRDTRSDEVASGAARVGRAGAAAQNSAGRQFYSDLFD